MNDSAETEMLLERVDSLRIANERLRERLHDATTSLSVASEAISGLVKTNRELSARIDRLQLHLTQGIEL